MVKEIPVRAKVNAVKTNRKFIPAMKNAIVGYYRSRKVQSSIPWNKRKSLDDISSAMLKRKSNIVEFTATAGTFFFRWKDGVTTVHSEKNWWRMTKYTTWQKRFNG